MFRRLLLVLFVLASGCAPITAQTSIPTTNPTAASTSTHTASQLTITPERHLTGEVGPVLALTHQQTDGNRLVAGTGGIIEKPIDIPLPGKPLWVVAATHREGSIWAVALESGEIEAFQIYERVVSPLELNLSMLPAGMPPALQVTEGQIELVEPSSDASPNTNPIRLGEQTLIHINQQGQLRVIRGDETETPAIDVLTDARILSDDRGRLLLLISPTDQYSHAVLGDMLEATAITLVDTTTEPIRMQEIRIDPGDVIEGIAPIWVDMDGDGEREIIVTQSNPTVGARIVVYREDGGIFASGDPIGRGFRWMHQLAVGQFIPGGAQEIAVIRTPHIGGVLEIYALEGDRLVVKGELGGYSSHQIGSRNLDSAIAGDFNGDGWIEIVVPEQSQTNLAGIQFVDDELRAVWDVAIGGKVSTNLAAVHLANGGLMLGVGVEDNLLRIWASR